MAVHFWSVSAVEGSAQKAAGSDRLGYSVAVLTWLLSAGVYIVAKWAVEEMAPWTLCFWRVFIALLVILPLVRHQFGPMIDLVRKRGLEIFAIGGIGLAVCQGLMYTSLEYTTAITAGLIFSMMPIFSLVLSRIILGEAMGPWQIIGSAIAFGGMVVIVVKGSLAALLSFTLNPGELIALVAALLFPVYSVLLKRAKFDLPRLPLLVLLLFGATLVSLPLYGWELLSGEFAHLNTKGYVAILYAAIPGGALMYLLFNWSIEILGAYRTGTTMYLQTIFVALFAWLLLGEAIEPYHVVGAVIIVIGVVMVLALRPKPVPIPAK